MANDVQNSEPLLHGQPGSIEAENRTNRDNSAVGGGQVVAGKG